MLEYEKCSEVKLRYRPNMKRQIVKLNLTPQSLREEKHEIARIWEDFIENDPEGFIKVLDKIGINYSKLETRNCPFCGDEISFIDLFKVNSPLGLGKVINLWKDKNLIFICKVCC
ncbi:MAG: hypothetical protein BAJALOKI3v1_680018 [Promethearchaeota archaeon]|jgi:hypothetical protein|nr:MAG: hypothetical protein BAJALOKI3v1_680018 [Candidatus Lokiarchaeota archaeon]